MPVPNDSLNVKQNTRELGIKSHVRTTVLALMASIGAVAFLVSANPVSQESLCFCPSAFSYTPPNPATSAGGTGCNGTLGIRLTLIKTNGTCSSVGGCQQTAGCSFKIKVDYQTQQFSNCNCNDFIFYECGVNVCPCPACQPACPAPGTCLIIDKTLPMNCGASDCSLSYTIQDDADPTNSATVNATVQCVNCA